VITPPSTSSQRKSFGVTTPSSIFVWARSCCGTLPYWDRSGEVQRLGVISSKGDADRLGRRRVRVRLAVEDGDEQTIARRRVRGSWKP
jgi:hypothetical protein